MYTWRGYTRETIQDYRWLESRAIYHLKVYGMSPLGLKTCFTQKNNPTRKKHTATHSLSLLLSIFRVQSKLSTIIINNVISDRHVSGAVLFFSNEVPKVRTQEAEHDKLPDHRQRLQKGCTATLKVKETSQKYIWFCNDLWQLNPITCNNVRQ
jgi:hypothetical protein